MNKVCTNINEYKGFSNSKIIGDVTFTVAEPSEPELFREQNVHR
jgi:hypothetical protein